MVVSTADYDRMDAINSKAGLEHRSNAIRSAIIKEHERIQSRNGSLKTCPLDDGFSRDKFQVWLSEEEHLKLLDIKNSYGMKNKSEAARFALKEHHARVCK